MLRKTLVAIVALLLLCASAQATTLLSTSVTTAVTAAVTTPLQLRATAPNIVLQGTFTWGSGGTTADAWVQTSVDGGTTWIDVANFHFDTTSARFLFNLTTGSVASEYTATDGTLTANTAVSGIIGNLWRVKFTTTGTYADSTTLRVDAFARGLTAQ